MTTHCFQSLHRFPCNLVQASFMGSCFLQSPIKVQFFTGSNGLNSCKGARLGRKRRGGIVCAGGLLPVDPWAPSIDSQSIASQLFAVSLFPYLGFLYYITKSKSAPKLTLFGFYFLLIFVGATIHTKFFPVVFDGFKSMEQSRLEFTGCNVGVVETAKVHYGTSLSNVDWLHGGAESFLTLTNLFIVLGLRQALRNVKDEEKETSNSVPVIKEEENSSI